MTMLLDRPAAFAGSYAAEDVQFLLKRVRLAPTEIEAKEALIQSGARHYSEMLSPEHPPSPAYLGLFRLALAKTGAILAEDVASLAARLDADAPDGREVVLLSLARAGTPIGVLLARLLRRRGRRAVHYAISIIRDRGVDAEALAYVAARHDPADAVFVDGWTGKGVIAGELRRALSERPFGFAPMLTVVADPAGAADLAAAGEDRLIASGLLNGVVSGLVSRSVLNATVVGPGDFHACMELTHLAPWDLSREFVDHVEALAPPDIAPARWTESDRRPRRAACRQLLDLVQTRTGVNDMNRIKPGLAEATRALLRRSAGRLLLAEGAEFEIRHLRELAAERGVVIEPLPGWSPFRAVAVIGQAGLQ